MEPSQPHSSACRPAADPAVVPKVTFINEPLENIYGKMLFFAKLNTAGGIEFAFNFSTKGVPLQDRSVLEDSKKALSAVSYPAIPGGKLFVDIIQHKELLSESWWPLGGSNYLFAEGKLYIASTSTDFGMLPLLALTEALASAGKVMPKLSTIIVDVGIKWGNKVEFNPNRDAVSAILIALLDAKHLQSRSYHHFCNPNKYI